MATVPASEQLSATQQSALPPDILISLCPQSSESLRATLANLAVAFPQQSSGSDPAILIATPDAEPQDSLAASNLRLLPYTPVAPTAGSWFITAADYVNTYKLMQDNKSSICLLLGAEAQSLHPNTLRSLATSATNGNDVTTPRYNLGPHDGLVNSAIFYPVTRALYGARPRYPLAIDLALSARMANRLATVAQRYTAANQNAAFIWPVAEAAAASFTIAEVPATTRTLPPPEATDLNSLLALVAGSLFADVDAKASFWQRARVAYTPKAAAEFAAEAQAQAEAAGEPAHLPEPPDVQPMLDSFRVAYTNLHEIWSLVLPPNSLLGLKKLSLLPTSSFRMPDSLWVRTVYDFLLAFRLRTINRGHLLGALTPLYLAWVASHLLLTSTGAPGSLTPEGHIEALAAAFEADKPYLVSRWRWPDRFNP